MRHSEKLSLQMYDSYYVLWPAVREREHILSATLQRTYSYVRALDINDSKSEILASLSFHHKRVVLYIDISLTDLDSIECTLQK